MFYILYQVTNTVNGKIYVGVHKTKKLDDGYMGSGKVINSAIKKYGIENFTRVILEQFENSTAMFAREKEVVTEEFLAREDTYNLRRGGFGGFDYINSTISSEQKQRRSSKGGKATSKIRKENPEINDKVNRISSETLKQSHLLGKIKYYQFAGRKHSEASKLKIGGANTQQGVKNSQFGKMWITNEIESKKILKNDPVPEGWRAGRVVCVKKL